MTPIHRPPCPDFLLPFLSEVTDYDWEGTNKEDYRYRQKLRETLSSVFSNRCCYCETYADMSLGVIERFRPRAPRSGKPHRKHEPSYDRLAFDWRNLYWACPVCNRYKADRFPIINSEYTNHGDNYEEFVRHERPFLLDPCLDVPDEHLRFTAVGIVIPLTDRGKATIDLLRLNRQQLVTARAEQAQLFRIASPQEKVERARFSSSHAAVWRQLLGASDSDRLLTDRALTRKPPNVNATPVRALIPDKGQEFAYKVAPWNGVHEEVVGSVLPPETAPETSHFPSAKATIDTETASGLDEYRAVSQYITDIKIENIGPIDQLHLDLSQSLSPQAPCFALLGENGVGKSTVLRALALALSGQAYVRALRITSDTLLADSAAKGSIRVSIGGGEDDVVMSLRRGKPITFNARHSRSLVVAYGATRLLPRGRHKPKAGRAHAKIDNLFDPFLPISDPAKWLKSLDEERLEAVNSVLSNLLPAAQQLQVMKDPADDSVTVMVGDVTRQINELSDGYQSMLGMAVDIMQVFSLVDTSMASVEGVVLIDELGNHFHPAWRLKCLTAMRNAFPRAQLIYSTHDPLCLRGLYEGEVAVLRRDKMGSVYALEDLPMVSRLRVDQLLSSEHFGLSSTLDPQMDEEVGRYEELLRLRNRTEEEEGELRTIVARLTDARYLGSSRRERLALQALDAGELDAIPTRPSISVKQLTEDTVAKLRDVMRQAQVQVGRSKE